MKKIIHLTLLAFCFIIMVAFKSDAQNSTKYQDCKFAFPVCELKTYSFNQMKGSGIIEEISERTLCFNEKFKETNSFWLKWKANSSGTMTFIINPNDEEDDFDFILYSKAVNDAECNQLQEVRCMAAGQNIGETHEDLKIRCKGRTGLSIASLDEFEKQGCKYSSDNFLKMLSVENGEEFVLIINNYDSFNGFSITFEGSTTLENYDDCSELNSIEQLQIVNVYPNPAINSINVEFTSKLEETVDIDLLDITGKIYQHFETIPNLGNNKNTFILSQMSSGTYLLRIKQGNFTTVRQFIKQ